MKKDYENKIQELRKKMTLEEKIGQLQQCGPSLVGAFEVSFEELLDMMFDGRITKEEFERLMGTAEQDFHEEDLRAGKIGSYNGIGDAATVNRLQKIAVEETRLGIPLLFGYDVIHGFRTVMPIPLAESCAWDPTLWEKTARVAAEEATAAGVHMTFAPMVDVAKDARWGRVSEGAGEDVLLNSVYGAAKVKGFQGENLAKEDSMAACVKHLAAYGAGEAGRDYNRVDLSMQRLWEEYLPPYKACIDAGARAVMPAFNDING
ncbi:MAG: glycosyl hydrolase, partial [Lachnospiraceae bacterium]|nr:glycosyl hydrolase [Lachnospiraceae bacterium]